MDATLHRLIHSVPQSQLRPDRPKSPQQGYTRHELPWNDIYPEAIQAIRDYMASLPTQSNYIKLPRLCEYIVANEGKYPVLMQHTEPRDSYRIATTRIRNYVESEGWVYFARNVVMVPDGWMR